MGYFIPVFLALILNCSGVYIFTTPKSMDCLPYLSYVIFLVSIFFLLWDINLKPITFRKLYIWAEFIIEFAVAMMLMELIMNNFWFPLEIGFISFLPKVADYTTEATNKMGFKCTGPCEMMQFLKWQGTLYVASYLLSMFFFLCIIHATRVLDFRILTSCGGGAFFEDSKDRGERFCKKIIRTIKPSRGHRQKISFAPGTKEDCGSYKAYKIPHAKRYEHAPDQNEESDNDYEVDYDNYDHDRENEDEEWIPYPDSKHKPEGCCNCSGYATK